MAGSGAKPAADTVLLSVRGYAWWLVVGGTVEILFGGLYLGMPVQESLRPSNAWADLLCVALGAFMVMVGSGILRLERWAYRAGWLVCLGLLGVCGFEIARWADGTSTAPQTALFAAVNGVSALAGGYLLSRRTTRRAARTRPFRGSPDSPGVVLCTIALAAPALALTFTLRYVRTDPGSPALLLACLLCGVLVIVTAFAGLWLRPWVWVVDLAWLVVLLGLCGFWLARDYGHARPGGRSDLQGLLFCGIQVAFVFAVGYMLFFGSVRGAAFGDRFRGTPLAVTVLVAGFALAVLAAAVYQLPDELGTTVVACTVFGTVTGVVVGLLPGAGPAERISGFLAGVLLAAASYVARGGLLPYTKGAASAVVFLLFVAVTTIAAVLRSRTWFVLLLLGVGTVYGAVEPAFQAAPSTYAVAVGTGVGGVFLGFSLGFTVSSLLGLELVAGTHAAAVDDGAVDATMELPVVEAARPEGEAP